MGEDAAEDRDEYIAESIFWVPPEARWPHLKAEARQPTIGVTVDRAMAAIERDNPALKDVLPKDYARPALDKQRLGQLIDMIGNIRVGDAEARSRDVLGRVYEYFLSQFASAEGKRGRRVLHPSLRCQAARRDAGALPGRVYDPCCGSSGMFVQSIEFIRAHASGQHQRRQGARRHLDLRAGVELHDVAARKDELGHTRDRGGRSPMATASITIAIRVEGRFHPRQSPFNVSDWSGDRLVDDKRWRYGVPPKGNANFAWVQHMVHHLAPKGVAGSCSPTVRCHRISLARARSGRA